MNCRFCKSELTHTFIDLFNSPASNSFLSAEELNEPEVYFPLKVYACHKCYLVQIDEYKKSDSIFNSEYVYFSSFSKSWLAHASDYVQKMTKRLALNADTLVVEVASNDGYLLQYFVQKNIPVLGIEPTSNTADAAKLKGVESIVEFFGSKLAEQLVHKIRKPKLLLGNNVLAHVPDIVDFVKGLKILLADDGTLTMEFPHLLQLVKNHQFDTIYHEHFSYLSFLSVKAIFESEGLKVIDVEELPTHGGSLRVYATHHENSAAAIQPAVKQLLQKEIEEGLNSIEYYENFQKAAFQRKIDFLDFLLKAKKDNKRVAAYGAAAKGNTFLNYAGVKADLIEFVVDANLAKQGKYLPGSHIPVVSEAELKNSKPHYVIIFPWNLKDEITAQLSYVKDWGGHFLVAIPELKIS